MTSSLEIKWWQTTVFYEIYIASFQDSNGDGIGDFKGITQRLDYLCDLGITGIWLTPFYTSPKVDNGYDVADYFSVDPDFGSLADFDHFIREAHRRKIRVIIDVVLNHVSTEHRWFKEAVSSPDSPYRDYFLFRDHPNNWESFFGGSAWEREPTGSQFYYHKFAPEQADLNWRNDRVMAEMLTMLRFWLDRGVDGFRFDVINFLSTEGIGMDNPQDEQGKQIHCHDIDQPGVCLRLSQICEFSRNYSRSLGRDCFLVGEVGHEALDKLIPYQDELLLDVVFNFNLGSITGFDVTKVYQQLVAMESSMTGPATLFFNSHDMPRSMSRLCNNDQAQARAMAALTLMARGICFLYFGEEIGLPDFVPQTRGALRDVQAKTRYRLEIDKGSEPSEAMSKAATESRDKSRLYMQWDNTTFAGFSTSAPWIGPDNSQLLPCVNDQVADTESLWSWYRQLISLRRDNPVLACGSYEILSLVDHVLTMSRLWKNQTLTVFINFDCNRRPIKFNGAARILASKGFAHDAPTSLSPYGVLIIRVTQKIF